MEKLHAGIFFPCARKLYRAWNEPDTFLSKRLAIFWKPGLKALANEDTLLRTHCRSWWMNVVFPCCANWETFVADTKCFWTKSEEFFVSATNVARAGKRGSICVGNNVSSFAGALITSDMFKIALSLPSHFLSTSASLVRITEDKNLKCPLHSIPQRDTFLSSFVIKLSQCVVTVVIWGKFDIWFGVKLFLRFAIHLCRDLHKKHFFSN